MPTIALPAALDTAAAVRLAAAVTAAFPGNAKIVLDAGKVDRIGVAGLQVLASAVRTADATGRALTIKAPSETVRAAVRLAGLGPVLSIDG